MKRLLSRKVKRGQTAQARMAAIPADDRWLSAEDQATLDGATDLWQRQLARIEAAQGKPVVDDNIREIIAIKRRKT